MRFDKQQIRFDKQQMRFDKQQMRFLGLHFVAKTDECRNY